MTGFRKHSNKIKYVRSQELRELGYPFEKKITSKIIKLLYLYYQWDAHSQRTLHWYCTTMFCNVMQPYESSESRWVRLNPPYNHSSPPCNFLVPFLQVPLLLLHLYCRRLFLLLLYVSFVVNTEVFTTGNICGLRKSNQIRITLSIVHLVCVLNFQVACSFVSFACNCIIFHACGWLHEQTLKNMYIKWKIVYHIKNR